MHSISLQQSNGYPGGALITNYQSVPRNNSRLVRIREAVKAWNKATPGAAQDRISQMVAAEWVARGGRGLLLVGSRHNIKQNFFRMINTPGPKNDANLTALIPVITDVMARDNEKVAREFGLVKGKTRAQMLADALREESESSHAVLSEREMPVIVKETLEAVSARAALLPADFSGPLMAMVSTMLGSL